MPGMVIGVASLVKGGLLSSGGPTNSDKVYRDILPATCLLSAIQGEE
jgi:hypothetical protein